MTKTRPLSHAQVCALRRLVGSKEPVTGVQCGYSVMTMEVLERHGLAEHAGYRYGMALWRPTAAGRAHVEQGGG